MSTAKLFSIGMRIAGVSLLALVSTILSGCMSIQTAARAGNVGEVKRQLAWGVNPNSRTFWYRTAPLHEAAAFGHIRIVELLLAKGADVNIRNEGGETPLHYAAGHGHTRVMETLLENGADPAQKGTGCGTPMQWAARNGQIQPIKTLVDHGVSIDQGGSGGVTALMEATSYGQMATVRFLLANGADANLGNGCSPLHIAAYRNDIEIGRILVQHGADSTFECQGNEIPRSFVEQLGK